MAKLAVNEAGESSLVYATYLGGSDADIAVALAVDVLGSAYLTGATGSYDDFPLVHAYQPFLYSGYSDSFIARLSPDGSTLLYSSYYGGDGEDWGHAIAIDEVGVAYLVGRTNADCCFPTKNGFQNESAGESDVWVAKFDTTQSGEASLRYATLLGGSDYDSGESIALDKQGRVYVGGYAFSGDDFPLRDNLYGFGGGGYDGFVAKLDPTLTGDASLVWSTFLGGPRFDVVNDVALDALGNVYVTGGSDGGLPTTDNAFQRTFGGGSVGNIFFGGDAFLFKFDGSGKSLLYGTYLGGTHDETANAVDVDDLGHVHIAGWTRGGFPLGSSQQLTFAGGVSDAFVAKFDTERSGAASLRHSVYLGGGESDVATDLIVDEAIPAHVWVTGLTLSKEEAPFPTTAHAVQGTFGGGLSDAFVAKLSISPDFTLSAIPSIAADLGGSGSSSVTVGSFDGFSAPVTLSAPSPPAGFLVTFGTSPLTPPSLGSTSSSVEVDLGPSITPGTYTMTVQGTAGTLVHTSPVEVTVRATSAGVTVVIGVLQAATCIDNAGVANALMQKLASAQALIDAGQIQQAINTLTALLHQLHAQAGRHIKATCTVEGVVFDPAAVLVDQVEALLASLTGEPGAPLMGDVATSSGAPVAGAVVALVDAHNVALGKAAADATGFYYFAATGGLVPGRQYAVKAASSIAGGRTIGLSTKSPTLSRFTWVAGEAVVNVVAY